MGIGDTILFFFSFVVCVVVIVVVGGVDVFEPHTHYKRVNPASSHGIDPLIIL